MRKGTAIGKLTVAFIRSMVMPKGGVKTIHKRENWSNKVWEIYKRTPGRQRLELFRVPEDQPPPRNDSPPV